MTRKRKIYLIIVVFLVLNWAAVATAATRSCSAEFKYVITKVHTGGAWQDRRGLSPLALFNTSFSGTGAPNKARQRASSKASSCFNELRSTAYTRKFGGARCAESGFTHRFMHFDGYLKDRICAEARSVFGTRFDGFQGQLYGKIDGNRCCLHSSRSCPYYGRLSDSPNGSQVINFSVICQATRPPAIRSCSSYRRANRCNQAPGGCQWNTNLNRCEAILH
jgi:hypothetical protein